MSLVDIKGRVIESGLQRGIVGVAVSDGKNVVSTNEQGYFEMTTDEEEQFIFISIPKGYKLPANQQNQVSFYRNIQLREEAKFELDASNESQHEYMFLHLTDLHLGRGNGMEIFQETVLPEINQQKSAFNIVTGDFSFQEGIKDEYRELLRNFKAPIFNAIGNHEMMMQRMDPKKEYKDMLGPTYYSFNYGEFHYVVLDGCAAAPWRKDWKNVVGFVDDKQLGWLKQDLEFLPKDTPIIGFIHIPIVSHHAERFGIGAKDEPAWEIINDEELTQLLGQYPVEFVLQGHIHENAHMYEQGVHYIESGAVCGKWWQGNNKDGSLPGYRFVHVSGKSATTYYKQTGKDVEADLFEIESPQPSEHIKEEEGCLLHINVIDGDPTMTTVKYRMGDNKWTQLSPVSVLVHPHMWEGRMDISGNCAGSCILEVVVSSPSFAEVKKQITVIIDV